MTLTVLTGESPEARATHTFPAVSHAGVTVGAVLETGLVAVAPPQALRTRLAATGTLTWRGEGGIVSVLEEGLIPFTQE